MSDVFETGANVHFMGPSVDWREMRTEEDVDDEQLDETPIEVIDLLGFDPLNDETAQETTDNSDFDKFAKSYYANRLIHRSMWDRFVGPKGGVGWRNRMTRQVRYQENEPGTRPRGRPKKTE